MINMKLLSKKGDYLDISDLMEVFGVSRTTIWRYEKNKIKGFPNSIVFFGKNFWLKRDIQKYIKEQTNSDDFVNINKRPDKSIKTMCSRTRATINLPNELLEKFRQLGAAKWLSAQVDKADVDKDSFFDTSDSPKPVTGAARRGIRGRPTIYHKGRSHTTVSMTAERVEKFRNLGHSHWLRKILRDADVNRDKIADE